MIAALVIATCTWADPGADKYTGSITKAVDRYTDIPVETRAKLKARMEARRYDELVTIRANSIEGEHSYENLRDMHFGSGRICRQVDRSMWKPDVVERGLVYCEDGHCLIIPTVCRNVSRVDRIKTVEPKHSVLIAPIEPLGAGGAGGSTGYFQPIPLADLGSSLGLQENPSVVSRTPEPPPLVALVPAPPVWWEPLPPPPIQPWVGVPPPIPEPSTWLLAALGVTALLWKVRRKDK